MRTPVRIFLVEVIETARHVYTVARPTGPGLSGGESWLSTCMHALTPCLVLLTRSEAEPLLEIATALTVPQWWTET